MHAQGSFTQVLVQLELKSVAGCSGSEAHHLGRKRPTADGGSVSSAVGHEVRCVPSTI